MHGTSIEKVIRLSGYLAANPRMVPRYFRESIGSRTPIDLALPWLSYAAIERLDSFIKPKHRVVEFGGGGSTLFFGKRAGSVLCLESSDKWASKIESAVQSARLENVTIEVIPYCIDDLKSYSESKHLHRIDKEKFDIILVDGYEENVPLRPTCFWHAEKSISPGGMIIVDDSWRYPSIRDQNSALKHEVHQSIGPCRPGVTTTDLFFY